MCSCQSSRCHDSIPSWISSSYSMELSGFTTHCAICRRFPWEGCLILPCILVSLWSFYDCVRFPKQAPLCFLSSLYSQSLPHPQKRAAGAWMNQRSSPEASPPPQPQIPRPPVSLCSPFNPDSTHWMANEWVKEVVVEQEQREGWPISLIEGERKAPISPPPSGLSKHTRILYLISDYCI